MTQVGCHRKKTSVSISTVPAVTPNFILVTFILGLKWGRLLLFPLPGIITWSVSFLWQTLQLEALESKREKTYLAPLLSIVFKWLFFVYFLSVLECLSDTGTLKREDLQWKILYISFACHWVILLAFHIFSLLLFKQICRCISFLTA